MNLDSFISIVSTFSISDPIRKKNQFLIELPNGELIDSKIVLDSKGEVDKIIDSNGTELLPKIWICEKLGRVSALARSISTALKIDEPFISPVGKFELHWSVEENVESESEIVCDKLKTICETDNFWESHLVYLTSDAGEGKTTILERLACKLAVNYQPGRGKLVVPISLSGKPFIRFEDIIIATLANKYKFSGYFYPSFLSLIKLGVIIPAFDGFEEMFVESPTGEAISAMADLIQDLKGKGLVLVAARSAYFEHQNLTTQGKLYNLINTTPVVFSKIRINRWRREQFIDYGIARGHTQEEATDLYENLISKFGIDHPIVTRAVLVKKLFEAFEANPNLDDFTTSSPQDYNEFFSKFVFALIDREAKKWLMKSRGISTPVLSVQQHYFLLSMVAKEMWFTRSEVLRTDVLETITDLFIDSERLNPDAAWQVKQRVKDHAVLRVASGAASHFEFDHQDFYQFFLGNAAATSLNDINSDDIVDICRRGRLSKTTLLCTAYELKMSDNIKNITGKLVEKINREQKSSYARENLAIILIILNQKLRTDLQISQVSFESEPFDTLELLNITFSECLFSAVKLSNIKATTIFMNCKILEVEYVKNIAVPGKIMGATEVCSLFDEEEECNEYAPSAIKYELCKVLEFEKDSLPTINISQPFEVDDKLLIIEKTLRVFYNRIEVNEDLLKQKLGVRFAVFWNDILPDLRGLVFEDVPYRGGGRKERIRIVCKLAQIQKALEVANGKYDLFLTMLQNKASNFHGFS
jgi:hypothetical protein